MKTRPDSAKSRQSRQTANSDVVSRLSATSSELGRSDPNTFEAYMAAKEREERNNAVLKLKPFEKKTGPNAKPLVPPQKELEDMKNDSTYKKGFAERNKEKMNTLKMSASSVSGSPPSGNIEFIGFTKNQVQSKYGSQKRQAQYQAPPPKLNAKITPSTKQPAIPAKRQNHAANQPPKTPVEAPLRSTGKIQDSSDAFLIGTTIAKSTAESSSLVAVKTENSRQQELRELERYVNMTEAKHIELYPGRYDDMIDRMNESTNLELINLADFLDDEYKSKGNINEASARIREYDNILENQSVVSKDNATLNNDKPEEEEQTSPEIDSMLLSLISLEDTKAKNTFMTEVMKGHVTPAQIEQVREMERAHMKLAKLEAPPKEDTQEIPSRSNGKFNRLMEKNRAEASGQLYRDCDYLTTEQQARIEELLNNDLGPSPYLLREEHSFALRRIDEGLRLYRLYDTDDKPEEPVLDDSLLPRDPNLRKEAQKKMIIERINSVNSRLRDIDKTPVTKAKIDALVKKYEHTRMSESTSLLMRMREEENEALTSLQSQASVMAAGLLSRQAEIDREVQELHRFYQELEEGLSQSEGNQQAQEARKHTRQLQHRVRQLESLQEELQKVMSQGEGLLGNLRETLPQDRTDFPASQPEIDSSVLKPLLKEQGYEESESIEDYQQVIERKVSQLMSQNKPPTTND